MHGKFGTSIINMRDVLIQRLIDLDSIMPQRDKASLHEYKRRRIESILGIRDLNKFENEARIFINNEDVLERTENYINNLPPHWNKNLWRDASLTFGDQIDEFIKTAQNINRKLIELYNNPPSHRFSQAIKDKAYQFIKNLPNFSGSDALSIPRFLELASEAILSIEALPDVEILLDQLPDDWHASQWQAQAAIYGAEVKADLERAADTVDALVQIQQVTRSWNDELSAPILQTIKSIISGIKTPEDPVDTRLSSKKARTIIKNFAWAVTILSRKDTLDPSLINITLRRSLGVGQEALQETDYHPAILALAKNIGVARLESCASVDLRDRWMNEEQYLRLKSFLKRSFNHTHDGLLSTVEELARAALIGFPIIDSPYILPPKATIGIEVELFGIQKNRYTLLDSILEILQPNTIRTKDTSIRPSDNTEGLEIVSPILQGNFETTIGIIELLKQIGGKADLPCALHVHHGIAKNYGSLQLEVAKQLILNYILVEDDLSFIDSPLTTYYKKTFLENGKDFNDAYLCIINSENYFELMRETQPGGRRRARVNLHSIFEHGTAEFRQHPGTVDPAEVNAWIKFTASMVDFAHQMVLHGDKAYIPNEAQLQILKYLVKSLESDRRRPIQWAYNHSPHIISLN